MGVFHIFLIVQIVPNRATHRIFFPLKKNIFLSKSDSKAIVWIFSLVQILFDSSTPGLNLLPVLFRICYSKVC